MKSLIKLLCAVAIIAALSGCAKHNPPSWYMQNSNISGQLIGRGQGDTFEEAKRYAISDLTSSIGSKIYTNYSNKSTVKRNTFDVNKKYEVNVENIFKEIMDVATSKHTTEKSFLTTSHFVEVTISKDALVSVLNAVVNKNLAWLKSTKEEKCLTSHERRQIRETIDQTRSYLAMIKGYSNQINVASSYSELNEYNNLARKKVKVQISSNDSQIMYAFMPLLFENDIEVTKGEGDGTILLDSTTEYYVSKEKNSNMQPIQLSLIRTSIHIENSCGEVLFEGKTDVVDQALNKKAAKENAVRKFIKKIQSQQISQGLKKL